MDPGETTCLLVLQYHPARVGGWDFHAMVMRFMGPNLYIVLTPSMEQGRFDY